MEHRSLHTRSSRGRPAGPLQRVGHRCIEVSAAFGQGCMPSRADLVPLVLVATAWIDLVTAIDNGIGVVPPKGWRR